MDYSCLQLGNEARRPGQILVWQRQACRTAICTTPSDFGPVKGRWRGPLKIGKAYIDNIDRTDQLHDACQVVGTTLPTWATTQGHYSEA